MLPKDKDFILKEKVKLYNNIGKINDCEGRLFAELEVYPTPRIIWDFEMLGNFQCNFPYGAAWKSEALNPLVGHYFNIDKPVCGGESWHNLGPVTAIRGSTAQAVYGDIESVGHKFIFYLPNTRFQYTSIRQDLVINTVKERHTDRDLGTEERGRFVECALDNTWSIRLDIQNNAIDWLNPRNRNRGTLITTVGKLYQPKYKVTESETFSELQTITLKDALNRITNLSRFLSYVNGGYLGPLYIQGYEYTKDQSSPIEESCAIALAFQTTSLEQLCSSWVTIDSDLKIYFKSFSCFEKMLQNPAWENTFHFVLAQYLQATQAGKVAWPVRAIAAGAALERLSYTILVEEETDVNRKADYELIFDIKQSKKAKTTWNLGKNPGQEQISVTGKRLRLLLAKIGLTKSRGYNDMDDVPAFLEVRNDAVHQKEGAMTIEQRWKLIQQAIQWIDEVLLWRLGYSGEYLDRTQGISIHPRYDLSLRDSNW